MKPFYVINDKIKVFFKVSEINLHLNNAIVVMRQAHAVILLSFLKEILSKKCLEQEMCVLL